MFGTIVSGGHVLGFCKWCSKYWASCRLCVVHSWKCWMFFFRGGGREGRAGWMFWVLYESRNKVGVYVKVGFISRAKKYRLFLTDWLEIEEWGEV